MDIIRSTGEGKSCERDGGSKHHFPSLSVAHHNSREKLPKILTSAAKIAEFKNPHR
jgi:hypothetical protein